MPNYVAILNGTILTSDILIHTSAFSQRATGPSSVCEGSTNVTLQCRIVFSDFPRDSIWFRNGEEVVVNNTAIIPNHNVIINSTTGAHTDLVITNVALEDNNTVYTCTDIGVTITSSVVLNVSGSLYVLSMSLLALGQSRFETSN